MQNPSKPYSRAALASANSGACFRTWRPLRCIVLRYCTLFQRRSISFSKQCQCWRLTIFDHVNVSSWRSRCYTALLNQLSVTMRDPSVSIVWTFGSVKGLHNVRSVQITNHWQIVEMRNQMGQNRTQPRCSTTASHLKTPKNQLCIQQDRFVTQSMDYGSSLSRALDTW